ncbi:hypothetical protein EON65_08305 [archaeon]|nr:MAG: hypothetical protein EON65_08305 [archaeon]
MCLVMCVFSCDKFRRGLIIDKQRGNVLKVDRHKYPRKVYHGLQEVSSKERHKYRGHVTTFAESNYVNIDTIFLLVGKRYQLYIIYHPKKHYVTFFLFTQMLYCSRTW